MFLAVAAEVQGFVITGGIERDGKFLVIKDERASEARAEAERWLRRINMLQ